MGRKLIHPRKSKMCVPLNASVQTVPVYSDRVNWKLDTSVESLNVLLSRNTALFTVTNGTYRILQVGRKDEKEKIQKMQGGWITGNKRQHFCVLEQ